MTNVRTTLSAGGLQIIICIIFSSYVIEKTVFFRLKQIGRYLVRKKIIFSVRFTRNMQMCCANEILSS
jgi:hypothetical protein